MLRFSYGTTPVKTITKQLKGERYPMELVGNDALVMKHMIDMGIDSHLEAFTESKFRETAGGRLICDVSPKDMLVLLRRLNEDDADEAMYLRRDILSVIDIEEI